MTNNYQNEVVLVAQALLSPWATVPTQIDECQVWGRLVARLVACGPIVNRPSGTSVPPFIYLDSLSRLSTLPRRHFCRLNGAEAHGLATFPPKIRFLRLPKSNSVTCLA